MRKITLFIASLFIAIGAMAQTPIKSADFELGTKYRIYNRKSDGTNYTEGYKAMSYNSSQKGCLVDYNITDETQVWIFEDAGDNKVYFKNVQSEKYFAGVGGNAGVSLVEKSNAKAYSMAKHEDGERIAFYWNETDPRARLFNDGNGNLYGWNSNGNDYFYLELANDVAIENVTFDWTTGTTWTEVSDYTSTVLNDNKLTDLKYIEGEITTKGASIAGVTFQYKQNSTSTASCGLNVRGVEVIDSNGNIIAGEYKSGFTGTNTKCNYTVNVAEAGTYKVRCYGTFDANNRANATNGTITIAIAEAETSSFTHDVTFTAEYATLYLGYKVTIPTGVEAYYIADTNLADGGARLTEIEGVIPATTPVILKKVGEESSYTFSYSEDEAAAVTGNLLKGSIADRYVTTESYVLGIPEGETEACLGKATKNQLSNTAFKNNANKVYLPITNGASLSNNIRFDFGGTTAIEEVEAENENADVIYDLQGRRVNEITEAGIYIVNGNKVLVK